MKNQYKLKNKIQNITSTFKENFKKSKETPKSKRKSLFLGFITVMGIFSATLLTPTLPAIAKDVPKNAPNLNEACPSPSNKSAIVPSEQIIKAISGAAGSVCALAVTSGSFAIGIACGIVVVIGILKAQGK